MTNSNCVAWVQMSRVRVPELPDFLRRSGSGTGVHFLWVEVKSYLEEKIVAPV
jgi:hypothetical protein